MFYVYDVHRWHRAKNGVAHILDSYKVSSASKFIFIGWSKTWISFVFAVASAWRARTWGCIQKSDNVHQVARHVIQSTPLQTHPIAQHQRELVARTLTSEWEARRREKIAVFAAAVKRVQVREYCCRMLRQFGDWVMCALCAYVFVTCLCYEAVWTEIREKYLIFMNREKKKNFLDGRKVSLLWSLARSPRRWKSHSLSNEWKLKIYSKACKPSWVLRLRCDFNWNQLIINGRDDAYMPHYAQLLYIKFANLYERINGIKNALTHSVCTWRRMVTTDGLTKMTQKSRKTATQYET